MNSATTVPSEVIKLRNARNRRAGKTWERVFRDGMRSEAFDIESVRDTGVEDEGDNVVRLSIPAAYPLHWVVVENKAGTMYPADFVDQAIREGDNFAKHRGLDRSRVTGIAVVKRRQRNWRDAYVLTELAERLDLPRDRVAHQPAGGDFAKVLVAGLRLLGRDVELIPDNPAGTEGDLVLRDRGRGWTVIHTVTGRMRPAEIIETSQQAAVNFAENRNLDPRKVDGLAVIKRRNQNWARAYTLETVRDYFGITDSAAEHWAAA